jgi:hypothetical protein
MNLVECFFRYLTEDAVREGGFASLAELVRAIEGHLADAISRPSATSGKRPAATSSSKSIALALPLAFPNIQYRHLRDMACEPRVNWSIERIKRSADLAAAQLVP